MADVRNGTGNSIRCEIEILDIPESKKALKNLHIKRTQDTTGKAVVTKDATSAKFNITIKIIMN